MAVRVKAVNQTKGNGLFTNKLLKKGQIVFKEAPLIAHQLHDNEDVRQFYWTFCGPPFLFFILKRMHVV